MEPLANRPVHQDLSGCLLGGSVGRDSEAVEEIVGESSTRCSDVNVTPHVAQKMKGSAIDGRTTRHPGYAISQKFRKRVEESFGWLKTVGLMRKLRHRGTNRVDWMFVFSAAIYQSGPPAHAHCRGSSMRACAWIGGRLGNGLRPPRNEARKAANADPEIALRIENRPREGTLDVVTTHRLRSLCS